MRNLFLALVLANCAFAAWHTWFASAPRPTHLEDSALPRITLVSEVPVDLRSTGVASESEVAATAAVPEPEAQAQADAAVGAAVVARQTDAAPSDTPTVGAAPAAEPAAAATPATAGARCTSVGPFRELSQAAAAAANLRAAGYQPLQRVAEGDIWIGYWVYIQAIPTEAQANEILAKFRAEGITDSYVIPNSDSGNLVSLGVFSEISGVSRRRDQVRALGFEPQVVDRTRRATVYWVDVVLTPEQTLDFDALQTPGRIIRLEQRACEGDTG
jgi:hypothetical protein